MNIVKKRGIFWFKPAIWVVPIALALTAPVVMANEVGGQNWNPVSSEKLIKMPAKYLNQYVENDFLGSPLAASIHNLSSDIKANQDKIQKLRGLLDSVNGEDKIEIRHQILVAKSQYLEMVETRQALDRQALNKKRALYTAVMNKLRNQGSVTADPEAVRLLGQQSDARKRMQNSLAMVNEMMSDLPGVDRSQYSQSYAKNLAKLEALKDAIAKHPANRGPEIDGNSVTREEFVRYLLSGVESELAIMDQESLMVGYMSRLVALDAQELEREITFGGSGPDSRVPDSRPTLADATDLFIGE